MFTRIRAALGIAFVVLFIMSINAFAKGGFSFIVITGAGLEDEIRSIEPALTEDFFAFADFYRHKTSEPADPGTGYEITRYYIDGQREIPFDHLHYYRETGFVYYDGIVNGSSEYDGEWYTANPEIQAVFESALSIHSMDKIQSSASTAQTQSGVPLHPVYLALLGALGVALISLFTYRFHKSFSQ
ncbi:MAG TPA: hypothetical protein VFG81_12830 [Anaerolineales bacterium]|jgi:hypothetical protein|nr:hypothetical protein [Anaerolineales bacterium]